MSREPSAETKLRSLRAEARAIERQLAGTIREREAYRIRATKAEQECAEWKRRFDLLLARTPPSGRTGQEG